MSILDRKEDAKVLFEFNGTRKTPCYSGYRPDHLIKDDYLTCGVHEYYDVEFVPPDGQAYGTITFMSPKVYPGCLWPGKRINIQEGSRIVGCATIIEVLNPILCISELDGAEIIVISELGEYGRIEISGTTEFIEIETTEFIEIEYLAICKNKEANTIYLFLCDKDFRVISDYSFESIADAVQNANSRKKEYVRWNRNA